MATFNNQATAQLQALMRSVGNPIPGLMVAGRAVRLLLQRHYREKDVKEPNKLGGERTHYWLGVAQAVNVPKQTSQAQVTVSISHPTILQKIKGGPITAKPGRMLAIPVHKDAYGRRPSVLERLLGITLFVASKLGRAFLAARLTKNLAFGAAPKRFDAVIGTTSNHALRIFYILKRSVTQKPDPTALPPAEEINRVINESFSAWVLRTQK
jgi:hypothetical protein